MPFRLFKYQKLTVRKLAVRLAVLAVLALAFAVYLALGSRDAPPPDVSDLPPPPSIAVPAASNGWYLIREAVRCMVMPLTNRPPQTAGNPERSFDLLRVRAMLDDNARALAWIDRAVACAAIAPPPERLSEDRNYLGWSPVSKCGRLLRLRARGDLASGRTNDALNGFAASLQLARRYAACPPERDLDALAACAEIRDVLFDLRHASADLDPRLVWGRFRADLADCSDLHVLHVRAAAMALAYDRCNIDMLQHWVAGDVVAPPARDSVFAELFPGGLGFSQETPLMRGVISLFQALPAGYRLQPNRTLAEMAAIRRGMPLAEGRELGRIGLGRASGGWPSLLEPLIRLLGPNGIGKMYITSEAGRQRFIDDGIRLAECAARGTRLVFALRMYEQEQGALPERLDALTPEWLEAVPADPYDGQAFRYDRGRRLVYAVGPNRQDDGGHRGGRCDDVLFPVSK